MKILRIIFVTFGFLSIASCQKESLVPYDETVSGAAIYFPQAYSSATVASNYDYFPFSFGYLAAGVKDTIIGIEVAATGPISSSDRAFSVNIGEQSSMIEGKHFDFVGEPVIRANHAKDTLKIVLYRTADIQEEGVDLQLKLVPNVNFHTDIKSRIYGGRSYNVLEYRIYADDISGQSYLWTTYAYASYVRSYYFGTYSKAKVDLMIRALAMDPGYFYDNSYESFWTAALLDQVASYMNSWLKLEKAEGRNYTDENGNEIKMGSLY